MHRRQFIETVGAVGVGAATSAFSAEIPSEPWLDRDRLRARNGDRSTVVCQRGIVCASQPLAAQAGVDILKKGGNCIDAANG